MMQRRAIFHVTICGSLGLFLGYIGWQYAQEDTVTWTIAGAALGVYLGYVISDISWNLYGYFYAREISGISVLWTLWVYLVFFSLIYCGTWPLAAWGAWGGALSSHFRPHDPEWIRHWYGLPLMPPLVLLTAFVGDAAFRRGRGAFWHLWEEMLKVQHRPGGEFWFIFVMNTINVATVLLACLFFFPFALSYVNWAFAEVFNLYTPFDRQVSFQEVYWFWFDQTVKGALNDIAAVFSVAVHNGLTVNARSHWVFASFMIIWRWTFSILFVGSAIWLFRNMVMVAYRRSRHLGA